MSTPIRNSAPPLQGAATLAGRVVLGSGPATRAVNPATRLPLEPPYPDNSVEEVRHACQAASKCFDEYRQKTLEERALFLQAIGDEIMALGDDLLQRTAAETGLPMARLEGERARTVGQLRLFAEVVRGRKFLGREQDAALPDRKPLPRPDLRLRQVALGPVAVFGASNFPLAFSVAGGDSASAWAAGCPVVVKAHPAHPGTSEMVASAVQRAIVRCGMPAGCFSLLHGHRNEIGQALASDPAICAIAFTGSRQGGQALMRIAAERPVPVPVYAEMSSVNPVFLLPGAVEARGADMAQAYVDSMTLGTGQFCTQPGLVFAVTSPALEGFLASAATALAAKEPAIMLTPGICAAYASGSERLQQRPALETVALSKASSDDALRGRGALFSTTFRDFSASPELADELFGPSSLVVVCQQEDELLAAAEALEGQLTATLQMEHFDLPVAKRLLPILERKAGRILVNGFPTGVEVGYAMSHGGPYPASSDGRSTSVGAHAIDRFLRPVCYQGFPIELLPEDLRVP